MAEKEGPGPYAWDRFTRKVMVHAPLAAVYAAWTRPNELEGWFLRSADYRDPQGKPRPKGGSVQVGDIYSWTWYGYDGPPEEGRVLEANGRDLVRFTFAGECEVEVRMLPKGSAIEVVLEQSHIPLDEASKVRIHMGCSIGWVTHLQNLRSVLQGGLDLREKGAA